MDKPKIIIKSSFLFLLAYNLLYVSVLFLAIIFSSKVIMHFTGFDIISSSIDSLLIAYKAIWVAMPFVFSSFSLILEHLVSEILFYAVLVFSSLMLLSFNDRIEVYSNKMVYHKGFSKQEISFSDVNKIYFEKKIKIIDAGDICIELDGSKDVVTVPYVPFPDKVRKDISKLVSRGTQK